MGKIKAVTDVGNVESIENLRRYLQQTLSLIVETINGNLELNDNIKLKIVEINFVESNVDTSIAHGLNKIPTGFIQIGSNVASIVYSGVRPADSQFLYLKSNVSPAKVKLLIF
jgi:hypothetical protein